MTADLGLASIGGEVTDVRSLTQMRLGGVGGLLFLAAGNSRLASSSIPVSACVLGGSAASAVAFTRVAPGSFQICQIGPFGLVYFFHVLIRCFL
jgi:hypothetical protein